MSLVQRIADRQLLRVSRVGFDQKRIGVVLLIVGLIWLISAWNMSTSVMTDSSFIGDTYLPSQSVVNLDKQETRRGHLLLASLMTLSGVILLATADRRSSPSAAPQAPESQRSKAKMRGCVKAGRLVRLLGWLQIIAAVIFAAVLLRATNAEEPMLLVGFVPLLTVSGVAHLYLGTALKEHKNWARIVGIILGISGLLGANPLGAFLLWWLLKQWDDGEQSPVEPSIRD